MKMFSSQYRKHHLWLGGLVVFFVLFALLRPNREAMNFLALSVVRPVMQFVARVCAATEVSVAEVLLFSAIWVVLWYIVWMLRKKRFVPLLITLVEVAATVAACACLLWGVFYGADSFQEKSGLTARGGTVAELTAVTEFFSAGVTEYADDVARDWQGVFAVPDREIFASAQDSYQRVTEYFPCLEATVSVPKALAASRAFSTIDFTGFYFPFTGEANVNVDSPACYLPVTICHEQAHQQGIASEQECNFVGIMAAITCDDPAYRYSGYLMGYVYLANALYRVDREAWQTIRDTIPQEVLIDLQYHRLYWAQFEGPVREVSNTVYDGFLKVNGLSDGIANYGTVVDLLLAYYAE